MAKTESMAKNDAAQRFVDLGLKAVSRGRQNKEVALSILNTLPRHRKVKDIVGVSSWLTVMSSDRRKSRHLAEDISIHSQTAMLNAVKHLDSSMALITTKGKPRPDLNFKGGKI